MFVGLEPEQTKEFKIPVVENVVVELALSRYWSAVGDQTNFEYEIEFSGVRDIPDFLMRAYKGADPMDLSYGCKPLLVKSLTRANIKPSANLSHMTYSLRPDTSKPQNITSLGDRDLAIDKNYLGRPYMTTLIYNFKPQISGKCMLWSPKFQSMLYENSWYKQQLIVFNEKKQFVNQVDAYGPNSGRNDYFTVDKDQTYTLHLQIAHHNLDFLKTLHSTKLYCRQPLEKTINLTVVDQLLSAGDHINCPAYAFNVKSAEPQKMYQMYILGPNEETNGKANKTISLPAGYILNGTAKLDEKYSIPIQYTVQDKIPKKFEAKSADSSKDKKDEKKDNEKLTKREQDLRDHMVAWLGKYPDLAGYQECKDKHPDHLPVYEKVLSALFSKLDAKEVKESLDASFLNTVCEDIITKFNIYQVSAEANLKDAAPEVATKKNLLKDAHFGKLLLAKAGSTDEKVEDIIKNMQLLGSNYDQSNSSKHNLSLSFSQDIESAYFKLLSATYSEMLSGKKDVIPLMEFTKNSDENVEFLQCKKLSLAEVESKLVEFLNNKGWGYLAEILKKDSCYNNLPEILSF